VQHVIAKIREQYGVIAFAHQHVAERMLYALNPAHALAIRDNRGRRQFGDGDAIRIRHLRKQRLDQIELREQIAFGHRVLRGRQYRECEQIDRIDVGGAVDVDLDLLGEVIDHTAQPFGFRIRIAGRRAPLGARRFEQGCELDRLAEIQRNMAVVLAQHLAHAGQQAPPGLFFLSLAREFADV
jgi:hypothetical protein